MIPRSHDRMTRDDGTSGRRESERSCNKLFERSEFKGLETEGVATALGDRTRPWGGCFDWPVQHFLTFGAQEPFQEPLKHVLTF